MHTLPLDDAWRDTLAALDASPGDAVLVTGEEPLWRSDLVDLLSALGARHLRAVLHTDLPGLDDDQKVRPFAPFDVRFRVRVPSFDPATYTRLTERSVDTLHFGLRNLQAFAYPSTLEVPVRPETVPTLADTIAEAMSGGRTRHVRLRLDAAPSPALFDALGDALRDLDARALRMRPRVVLDGLSAMALPVEALTDVDVRTEEGPDAPAPEGLDPDVRAARRVWLATPEDQRPGWRTHPLDRLHAAGTPVSLVTLRDRHAVYAIVDRKRDDRPLLAQTDRFGLSIAGRFTDASLASRFATLCRQVHAHAQDQPPADLAALRALAHVLRRSMKPKHDDDPMQMRLETPPPTDAPHDDVQTAPLTEMPGPDGVPDDTVSDRPGPDGAPRPGGEDGRPR